MNAEQTQRFMEKVTVGDDCWEWHASRTPKGYGVFAPSRRKQYAHRLSYELFVGPIPEGLQIDHLCRNPGCVRPDHLEAVTQRENILRGESVAARNARATHCPHGHPYDAENTYVRWHGGRECRTCNRKRWGSEMRPLRERAQ